MIARLALDVEDRVRARRQPPGLPCQAADVVVKEAVAAFERLEHQGEAAVAPDVDLVQRVHLHGGAQGHIVSPYSNPPLRRRVLRLRRLPVASRGTEGGGGGA